MSSVLGILESKKGSVAIIAFIAIIAAFMFWEGISQLIEGIVNAWILLGIGLIILVGIAMLTQGGIPFPLLYLIFVVGFVILLCGIVFGGTI